jgi:hypothetical protein
MFVFQPSQVEGLLRVDAERPSEMTGSGGAEKPSSPPEGVVSNMLPCVCVQPDCDSYNICIDDDPEVICVATGSGGHTTFEGFELGQPDFQYIIRNVRNPWASMWGILR